MDSNVGSWDGRGGVGRTNLETLDSNTVDIRVLKSKIYTFLLSLLNMDFYNSAHLLYQMDFVGRATDVCYPRVIYS